MLHTYRGRDIDGPDVGIAFVGTMCSSDLSSSVVQDGGADADFVSVVATHELGHSFNMQHDNELRT